MEITVDRKKCLGNGNCVLVAPELFDQDEDGLVVVLEGTPSPEQRSFATKAAVQCPVRAISIAE